MKTSPESPETDVEQKPDLPRDRILTGNTPPPTTKSDPWSLEQQCLRDIQVVSIILQRYAQHRDLIELRGGRTIGISEITTAMLDRTDLCALFSSEERSRCTCGCDERGEVCERFNEALK